MDFQVVVLAGGSYANLDPLVSDELPKALLPVANRPVLAYVLDLLEGSNLHELIVVVETEDEAVLVEAWISAAYADRLHVNVVAVSEDIGTAGALRTVAHHLTANDVLIVSGDLVTDVPPGAVAAMHRRHGAALTALICPLPVSGPSDGSSGGKDKAKKLTPCNIIGLDPTRQFLLHIRQGVDVRKDVCFPKSLIRAAHQVQLHSDLMDAHMYAINRSVLLDVLDKKEKLHSISTDVVPYIVRTQLRSKTMRNQVSKVSESENGVASFYKKNLVWLSQHRELAPSAFQFQESLGLLRKDHIDVPESHKCCAYISDNSKYCARVNSIQAYCDINKDVIGDASHLSGYSFSPQKNIIHSSAVLGTKTTVGPQCIVDEGSELGDKCSIKKSVIGRHCRIGSNVKIASSVVFDYVTIEDGCVVQGSIICSNVHLQERASLRDCQIGAGYVVTSGSEYKSEALTRK